MRTWRKFVTGVQGNPSYATADLYLFAYPSVRRKVAESAESFANFVSTTVDRGGDYERIVLVGHSEGGVVVRKMVLDALKPSGRGLDERFGHIRLFAPAIGGASASGLLGSGDSLLAPLIAASGAYKSLKPDSQLLTAIRSGTERLQDDLPLDSPAYAHIVWASRDKVVEPGTEYFGDWVSWASSPTDHSSVVRPSAQYQLPLTIIDPSSSPVGLVKS